MKQTIALLAFLTSNLLLAQNLPLSEGNSSVNGCDQFIGDYARERTGSAADEVINIRENENGILLLNEKEISGKKITEVASGDSTTLSCTNGRITANIIYKSGEILDLYYSLNKDGDLNVYQIYNSYYSYPQGYSDGYDPCPEDPESCVRDSDRVIPRVK
ncbi:MAG: hypothetical protein HON90_06615 [Halobacteriovoraceae bacterium]|jgi:hypothetical protein|nr:hypothetical protein [Halobacteriovoraceae bacterium]